MPYTVGMRAVSKNMQNVFNRGSTSLANRAVQQTSMVEKRGRGQRVMASGPDQNLPFLREVIVPNSSPRSLRKGASNNLLLGEPSVSSFSRVATISVLFPTEKVRSTLMKKRGDAHDVV